MQLQLLGAWMPRPPAGCDLSQLAPAVVGGAAVAEGEAAFLPPHRLAAVAGRAALIPASAADRALDRAAPGSDTAAAVTRGIAAPTAAAPAAAASDSPSLPAPSPLPASAPAPSPAAPDAAAAPPAAP